MESGAGHSLGRTRALVTSQINRYGLGGRFRLRARPDAASGAPSGRGRHPLNSSSPPPKPKKTDPLIGSLVAGKFKILSLVAAGGMGKVYRAEQIPLGRLAAVKVLHVHAHDDLDEEDPHFKKRFLREASILAKLQHPNIVTIFDYGAIDGDTERYFMAMEFLSGQTLSRRIADKTALTARDTVKIGRQIARGLTEAHGSGIIHRDLKPSNVMLVVGRDGEELAKIVDFGIVKIIGDDDAPEQEELTQEGSFIGSPKYMAPEQITRGGKIDTRTDIYSFGIILYQCLTGTVPFEAESSVQTLMAHLNQLPPPMRERQPALDIPDWLDQMVMSCIEKDPERRPQTMESIARMLADAEAAMASGRMPASLTAPMAAAAVAARPSARGAFGSSPGATQSGTLPSGPQVSITPQGTIASVTSGADDKTRASPGMMNEASAKRSPIAFIVAALTFASIAGGAVFALRPPPSEPPTQAETPPPAPPPPSIPPPEERASRFTLTIESVPSGADVREGDRVVGTTPVTVSVDNDSVKTAPRAFTVVKDGFEPYALAQGASQTSVHLVAPLVAAPAASARAPGRRNPGSPHAPPQNPSAATSQGRPDLDIRMNR